jgi:hypothetical protein
MPKRLAFLLDRSSRTYRRLFSDAPDALLQQAISSMNRINFGNADYALDTRMTTNAQMTGHCWQNVHSGSADIASTCVPGWEVRQ